eukprot:SAG31_NODE_32435_length_356_cov_0.599222_2_plen_25_part_01
MWGSWCPELEPETTHRRTAALNAQK